jgi:C4-dicarboxylate-specific signal transduction histidine kinase
VPEEIRSRVLVGGETTKGEGRGFGLRYAQKLLRKYGGRLTYDERYTAGARFVFELLLA